MSTHINAPEGAIADKVLLPGDPLRAKFIAENFLEEPKCYNQVRGMFGFTGTYKGVKVSVQGTGMGQPSLSIYVNELFRFYDVQKAIRVGTIGSVQDDVNLKDTVIANAAFSDSYLLNQRFGGLHYAPASDFGLLYNAYNKAKELGINVKVGPVFMMITRTGNSGKNMARLESRWNQRNFLRLRRNSTEKRFQFLR